MRTTAALVGALACFQASAAFMFPSAPKAPMVSLYTPLAFYTFTHSTATSVRTCMAYGCYDLGPSRSKPCEVIEGVHVQECVANHDLYTYMSCDSICTLYVDELPVPSPYCMVSSQSKQSIMLGSDTLKDCGGLDSVRYHHISSASPA